ncbi:MAG TPA: S8 family serine peptidase [Verrucomicrobiae bacterium]|nr:S8 family serine peptidase [Verrucomicrobiae bacterium]
MTLLRYVPDDAFIARFENATPSSVRALEFVRYAGEFRSEHKIESRLKDFAPSPGQAMEVAVLLAPDLSENERLQARSRFAAVSRETVMGPSRVLRGSVSPEQLNSLAESGAVLWIEPAPQMRLYDEVSSRIVAGDGPGNQTRMQSLGYNGAGVTVAVADSGLDSGDTNFMHPDIQGRVKALFYYGNPGQLEDAADEHSHGTHCAGIIAGNGAIGETDELGFLYGLGVAPGASLIGQRLFDAAGGYAPPPSFETVTRDAKRAGADIGSNSWGDDTQGHYDISAMEFDALVRDADLLAFGDQPYILEFSAGNAGPGYQTIGSPAVGKNVIATGASQNDRFNLPIEEFAIYADGSDAMADFSSRGPCADGRIKPDLVAPGSWIASLRSVFANDGFAWWPISESYLYQGGTSQAGPQVAGAAAVFVQYWRATQGGVTPSPALVKAALINSASDMDDGITTAAVPNNDEGWGRVNLPGLIGSTRNYQFTDQTSLLTNGAVFETRVLVGASDEPLKVTLAYTDVPGLPAAAVALVNDLDLEVVSPTGEIYRGNRFNDGESLPDTLPADSINNVEAVHLSEPVAGEYLVRVRGTRVVEDARIDSPGLDQDFALVTSGGFAPAGTGIITADRESYRAPDQMRLTLVDYDLAGQASAAVLVRSTSEPAGKSVPLFPSQNHGVFTGFVATVTGAPNGNSQVQVANGDEIEVAYTDASPPASRTFTATIDLNSPVIQNLGVSQIFGEVSVSWETDEPARGEIYFGEGSPASGLSNRVFATETEFSLANLPPNTAIRYFVVAIDEAGNRATNDNSGAFFTVTNIQSSAVLLLDSYTDYGGLIAAPPLSGYTEALDRLGTPYEVFDARDTDPPTLLQLQSYRCVIWRMDELLAPDVALVQRLASYVTNGGSLFVASMEAVTRLGEAGAADFARDILQVQANVEDMPVNHVIGFGGDPVGAGIDVALDYSPYAELLALLEFGGVTDPSDWISPTTNGAPVALADDQIVGVRSPRTGLDLAGKVVYLSFPLDAIPLGIGVGNNRAGLLRNILAFLTPEPNTSIVTLDSDVYSLPGRALVEVEDADRRGAGTIEIAVRDSNGTNELHLILAETTRAGLFRGDIIFSPTNSGAPGIFTATPTGMVSVDYFDASASRTNSVTATFDTNAPVIADVLIEPGYLEALVFWNTSKAADSLVQYGESPDQLPINFTAYDALPTTEHELFLTGLKPNTTYYFRVTSRDRAGNATTDDNNGQLYSFTTLDPQVPPWNDNLEVSSLDWSVISADESESQWERGTPGGGLVPSSGTNAWGSNLGGGPLGHMESYLISPGILLTGGNQATLRFSHQYDFTPKGEVDFQLAAIQIITNISTPPILLHQFAEDFSLEWEEFQFDLTPYVGQVVYIVWYHFVFSIDGPPRLGWLIDDVSIEMNTIVPGRIEVTNNLWQSVFALSGPSGRTGSGRSTVITNAAPGQYVIQFGDAPYHVTPAPQTNALAAGGTITFAGNYTFLDANTNQIPDGYEMETFGVADPERTMSTDSDGDGASDWAEFVAGTDPNNAVPHLRLDVEKLQGNGIRMTWNSIPGNQYRVWGSSNLVAWVPLNSWTLADTTRAAFTNTMNSRSAQYLRVEVGAGTSARAPIFKVTTSISAQRDVRLNWPAAPGHGYRVWSSTNLTEWIALSDWIRASAHSVIWTPPPQPNPVFFRIQAEP